MRDETTTPAKSEHVELIDMRTHLTVAMLAAAQLERKTKHLPEAEHLQEYLDQSLKSLVGDVERVDALVTHDEARACVPARRARRGSRVPRLLGWLRSGIGRCMRAACERIYRRQYARMSALYLSL